MSLGLGCVVEQGAVVLTDSGLTLHQPDGSTRDVVVDDKLLMTEGPTDRDVRLVVVHAGPAPKVQPVRRPLPEDHGDFDVAASNVWRAMTDLEWADWVLAEHRTDDHATLVSGSVRGQRVKLALMSTRHATNIAPDGSICAIGLDEGIWQHPRRPQNVVDALIATLEVGTSMMRRRIAEAARLGESPGVAWPLHAAVLTPERLDIYEYGETHPQCAW